MSDTPSRHLSHSTFGIVRILLARRNLEAEQADQLLGWEAGHTQGLLEDPASAALGEFFDLFQLALGDFEPSGPNPHALPRSFYSDPTFHRAPLQPSNSLPEDEATRTLHLLAFILRVARHLMSSQSEDNAQLGTEFQALLLEYYRVFAPYLPTDDT